MDEGGRGLAPFLRKEGLDKACIVFAPCQPGRWLDEVEAVARSRRGDISVLVGVDGLRQVQGASVLRRALLSGTGEHRQRVQDLRKVCDRLVATGVPVLVVDRAAGVPVHPQHLSRLEGRS